MDELNMQSTGERTPSNIAGYILTGGKNSRMDGRPKFFLTLEGRTFGDRILDSLSSLEKVYLSVNQPELYADLGIPMVKDELDSIGPMGGILSGFHALPDTDLLVTTSDSPFLTSAVIDSLLEAYRRRPILTLAICDGSLQPLLGIYPAGLRGFLEGLVRQGNYSMREPFRRHEYQTVEIEARAGVNINTPEEYRIFCGGETNRYLLHDITIEEAQDLLCSNIPVIHLPEMDPQTETVSIDDALGRVLAEDATALYDQPPFPRSPLDGYAFRGEDTVGATQADPAQLKVVGKIYAGYHYEGTIGAGEALRLMTGAPIPEGANAVIRQEETHFEPDASPDPSTGILNIFREMKPYSNYCFRGEDYRVGDVLLTRGHTINSGAIAVLSSLGITEVSVYKKPSIAVFTSGDEVIEPGQQPAPGKIYNSNRHYFMARLRELGVPAAICHHVQDDPKVMAQQIRDAAETCPFIITVGGVSVGEKDIMHDVTRILDAKVLFWRIRVKPGSPTLAFRYRNTLIVSLSGNPFGAIANMELLVRPVLARLTGDTNLNLKKQRARIVKGYTKPSGMRRYLRGYIHGDDVTLSDKKQTSGAIASMAGCNCFVEIPPDMEGAKEGCEVWVYLL